MKPTHQGRVLAVRKGSAVGLALAVGGLLFSGGIAGAQQPTPWAEAQFSGSATGSVVHVDALQEGDVRLVNTDVAFSGAAIDSGGLFIEGTNEMQRPVYPALPDKSSYARGSALEVGVGEAPEGAPQAVIAGLAEADAPPDTGPVTEEIGPVPADPLAYASLVRGQALALWDADQCIVDQDISRGLGFAADVQLLDAGEDEAEEGLDQPVLSLTAPEPERAVSQSLSRSFLIPQPGTQAFGLATEVRQTIAPTTLFKDTANQVTIEFLGEWVLRAETTGLPGGALVHYGPGEASPETPVLRFIDPDGEVQQILFQDFFGEEGVVIPLGPAGEIVIGEDPRAIGGDVDSEPTAEVDGTAASAAVDVVRVKLFEALDELGNVEQRAADLRIGHMEVQAQVPAGGISCPVADVPEEEVLGVELPRTGPAAASAVLGGLSLLAMAGAGLLLRRRLRP